MTSSYLRVAAQRTASITSAVLSSSPAIALSVRPVQHRISAATASSSFASSSSTSSATSINSSASRFYHANARMKLAGEDNSFSSFSSSTSTPTNISVTAAASTSSGQQQATGANTITSKTKDLKPSQLVSELDRFIIGQGDAKKAVAIALRNRWRRHRLPKELRADVTPKNLLLIGPTGCGKTEIARRLAKLTHSPFIKVEATKYTETGFHGKDVDSIIQDLVRVAIAAAKARRKIDAKESVQKIVNEKLLAALTSSDARGQEAFRELLETGQLESMEVEIEVPVKSALDDDDDLTGRVGGAKQNMSKFLDFMQQRSGPKTEFRKLKISEARPLLEEGEIEALVPTEEYTKEAIRSVQEDGIVFIDEIDKIATTGLRHSTDASAEGVQRDLLPLLEGTTISTKQGDIQTDHILFICSGAFHAVKVHDLLAELQGRLPIVVKLTALTEDDLYKVLSATENSLIAQQTALVGVDGVKLTWEDSSLREIAKVAVEMNRSVENIGARRLHTVIEKIIDELSFNAADAEPGTEYKIDAEFVRSKAGDLLKSTDLGKFVL